MSTVTDEWIDVEIAAREMGFSDRVMWGLLKRWGVRGTHPHQMGVTKFRRSEFEAKRDAGLEAPPPPARKAKATIETTTPTIPARKIPDRETKRNALKPGRA